MGESMDGEMDGHLNRGTRVDKRKGWMEGFGKGIDGGLSRQLN